MTTLKRCSKCRDEKPASEFATRTASSDGLQNQCKVCNTASTKGRADRNRAWAWDYKLLHPCVDCGETDPRCLDFDHLPGEEKETEVSRLVNAGRPLELIIEEVAKCEVVCSNCHRKRTHGRGRPGNREWFSGSATSES